jgi:hypothetical protein
LTILAIYAGLTSTGLALGTLVTGWPSLAERNHLYLHRFMRYSGFAIRRYDFAVDAVQEDRFVSVNGQYLDAAINPYNEYLGIIIWMTCHRLPITECVRRR